MKNYLVLYKCPVSVLEEWMQKDEAERKPVEEALQAEWKTWMEKNGSAIKDTAGAGKTKRVSPEGISDVKNDVMMYSIVEAESDEAAAQMFADHPHFKIPQTTIEVMPSNSLTGMQ
jgi:hypothetical protein